MLMAIEMGHWHAGREDFLDLGSEFSFYLAQTQCPAQGLPAQLLDRVREKAPGIDQAWDTRRHGDRLAFREVQVDTDPETGRCARHVHSRGKPCTVRHQSRTRNDALAMPEQDGPINAIAQAKVIGIHNETLHGHLSC
jgi:hypothetical protein